MNCMALDSRQEVQTVEWENSLIPLQRHCDPVASSCLVIIRSIFVLFCYFPATLSPPQISSTLRRDR